MPLCLPSSLSNSSRFNYQMYSHHSIQVGLYLHSKDLEYQSTKVINSSPFEIFIHFIFNDVKLFLFSFLFSVCLICFSTCFCDAWPPFVPMMFRLLVEEAAPTMVKWRSSPWIEPLLAWSKPSQWRPQFSVWSMWRSRVPAQMRCRLRRLRLQPR